MDNLGTSMPTGKESKGPVVGIVVIIVLLILGGVYLWQSQSPTETPIDGDNMATTTTATTTGDMMGTSTNPDDIQADVNATDVNNLDAGMNEVNAEVEVQ